MTRVTGTRRRVAVAPVAQDAISDLDAEYMAPPRSRFCSHAPAGVEVRSTWSVLELGGEPSDGR